MIVARDARTVASRHLFSVDVEDYFQVSAFEQIAPPSTWGTFESRVERNTDRILALLARHQATATFFTLGWVADKYPSLVRRIAEQGHEIASHSYMHRRVTTMTRDAFREDVRRSKDVLEQLIGVAVEGFRAPSFSIVKSVEWAWETLVEEGFVYDSSVFPIYRPGYGNPGSPREPYDMITPAGTLKQYPLATLEKFGVRLPAAGGAYLRLLPYTLCDSAVSDATARGVPAMCYVHPWEVDPKQPRMDVGRLTRIRHYGGLERLEQRLDTLLASHAFGSVREYTLAVNAPAAPAHAVNA